MLLNHYESSDGSTDNYDNHNLRMTHDPYSSKWRIKIHYYPQTTTETEEDSSRITDYIYGHHKTLHSYRLIDI